MTVQAYERNLSNYNIDMLLKIVNKKSINCIFFSVVQ